MTAFNINDDIAMNLLNTLMTKGESVSSNGSSYTRLCSQYFSFSSISTPFIISPMLSQNFATQILEYFCVMGNYGASDNDRQELLKPFLPRNFLNRDYDSLGIRQGDRLLNWYGHNQLNNIVNMLSSQIVTSRAVAAFFDPLIDSDTKTLNYYPCQHWWQFIYKNSGLNMNIALRSIDILRGLCFINLFEWQVTLSMVSNWLNLPPGNINVFVGHMVINNADFERIKLLNQEKSFLREKWYKSCIHKPLYCDIPFVNYVDSFREALSIVKNFSDYEYTETWELIDGVASRFINNILKILYVDFLIKTSQPDAAFALYESIDDSDYKIAATPSLILSSSFMKDPADSVFAHSVLEKNKNLSDYMASCMSIISSEHR